nr:hypothetical protein CPGR_05122 [Mycolicibacter nonchromogenicus]
MCRKRLRITVRKRADKGVDPTLSSLAHAGESAQKAGAARKPLMTKQLGAQNHRGQQATPT